MELKHNLRYIVRSALQNYTEMTDISTPMTKIIPGWWKSIKHRAVVETLFVNKGPEFGATWPLWVLRNAILIRNEADLNRLTNQVITKYFELTSLVYRSKGWPLEKARYVPSEDAYFKEGEDLYPTVNIESASSEAKKVIELAKKMDDTFGTTHSEHHLQMAIMAGLIDAYKRGYIAK